MKQRRAIAIFTAIILSNQIFCMEKKKQIKQSNSRYKNLEFVLKNNLTITAGIEYNATPPRLQYETLKQSIKDGDMVYLKLCLTYKFNPNRYHKQLSLLHYAIKKDKPEAITILSHYNPDLVPLNESGQTPLDYAIVLQHQDCINQMTNIIYDKTNELLKDQKHCGLTKHIVKKGFCKECVVDLIWQLRRHKLKGDYPYQTLETFLKNSIFTKDGINCSPIPPYLQCKMLKNYIKKDDTAFLNLCLNHAFNQDHLHKLASLLHYAIKHHSHESITILAEHNVDLLVTNEKEETPLDYAMLLKCQDCIHPIYSAIGTKINQILIYKKPYEPTSTNHSAKPKSREDYVGALIWQLQWHKLYEPESKALIRPLFITDNAATVLDSSFESYSSS